MVFYAVLFLVMALVSGAVGLFALTGASAVAGKVLFGVFLLISILIMVFGHRREREGILAHADEQDT